MATKHKRTARRRRGAPIYFKINITCEPPEGVNLPLFVLSHGRKDTVQWHNPTDKLCTLTFSGGDPFPPSVTIDPGGDSDVYSATKAGPPPPGWPSQKVYKVYHYGVDCKGGRCFKSPGGGIKP